jgi:peptidoglycan/LPS O-acetylase OafA/YrhL
VEKRASPDRKPAPARLEFLDGLRALAALAVVLHHARLEVWVAKSATPLAYFGRLSVDVFIVISGFCLMLPVLKTGGALPGGVRTFLWRRCRRILPPYYGALGISLLLGWLFIGEKTGSHWDMSLPITRNGIVANALMLQDVVHRYEINHVFWSIAVEWKIYLVFPLILLLWRHLGGVLTTTLMLVLTIPIVLQLHQTRLAELTVHYLGLFCLGMLAASLARAPGRFPWRLTSLVGVALVTALVWIGWGLKLSAPRAVVLDVLVGLTTLSVLVMLAAHPAGALHRLLSVSPLARIGVFSYSLYLVHAPLQQLLWQYFLRPLALGEDATYWLLALVGTPLIVGCAYLFFLALERPFLRTPRVEPAGRAVLAVSR